MELKEQIQELLETLKAMGYTRARIEDDLGYSPKYISQQLSKGGNQRLLKALQKYRNSQVHGVAKSNPEEELKVEEPESPYTRLRIRRLEQDQEKYIKKLEEDNIRLWSLVSDNQDIIKTNLTLVLATVRTISVRQLGTGNVALKSLERLEKQAGLRPGSLVKEADKEIGQIEKEAHVHDSEVSLNR
jgi:hypothetical protein